MKIEVRNTREEDVPAIIDLCRRVYPASPPWGEKQIRSHLEIFPEGQWVAIDNDNELVRGMAASLIVWWNDYEDDDDWRDFTDHGMFTNHDPDDGRTLYGAEIMVDPAAQGHGIGKEFYKKRRELAERLGLLRIRAGARLRGYHRYADQMRAEDYVVKVVREELGDPTLTFQLHQGFHVMKVVRDYLRHDPESLGWAALIEWINEAVATPEDYRYRNPRFQR
ncbi:MAG: GNAT family N-acetyltransferase [Bryobacteraceae bacterium]|nr:GNAT family N-acetyltransferase [Bryobacteraceae bacterium]